jgi:hypothetical protein
MTARSLLVVVLVLGACGGEDATEPQTPQPGWENKAPILYVASPGALSVGESLEILGKDFIQPDRGYPLVVFKGTFFDDAGAGQAVDFQAKGKCQHVGTIKCGKLTWRLWPNIVFAPSGDKLGSFLGTVAVINVGNDGSQKPSERLPFKLQVKPSLIPVMARPTSGNCQAVVDATLEDTGMAFIVEAVGLRPATTDTPLTFYWTFMSEHWNVAVDYGTFTPGSIWPKSGPFQVEDVVESGTTSSIADGGDRNFLLKVGSDILGNGRLKVLKTLAIPANKDGDSYTTTVNVAAVDASGKSAALSIPIDVTRIATMAYDGNTKIAERYPPQQVSDCIPGGDIGRNVSYSEDKAESRSRSMSFQYHANAGMNVSPWPGNPWVLGINFSVGFGVDVGASVNSSNSKGMNISGQILPGEYGAFFRQTTKLYRIGNLVGHNACGQTVDLGQAILTDWIFTPELATGPICVPPSQLAPAGKFM